MYLNIYRYRYMGFPGGSAVRNMPVVQETWVRALVGKIPWRAWHPLQNSCLENPRDREAWQAAVHRVAQSQTTEANKQQRHTDIHMKDHYHRHCFVCQLSHLCLDVHVGRTRDLVSVRGEGKGHY